MIELCALDVFLMPVAKVDGTPRPTASRIEPIIRAELLGGNRIERCSLVYSIGKAISALVVFASRGDRNCLESQVPYSLRTLEVMRVSEKERI
jgi:hypothetical protein